MTPVELSSDRAEWAVKLDAFEFVGRTKHAIVATSVSKRQAAETNVRIGDSSLNEA